MTKKEIRDIYKAKRKKLTHRELKINDDLLLIQFQQFAFPPISTVLSYQPIVHLHEPGTQLLTSYLQFQQPDIQIAYPICAFDDCTMQAVAINEQTEYDINQYGIAEPVNGMRIAPEDIDLVLLPLVAFDSKGFRVGYGKGFYDRFLNLCPEDVITIGISYFGPVDAIEDLGPFDIPMKYCLTPQKIYAF